MAFLNEETNELHIKIVYAGSAGCGKTTNLQSLFKQTSAEVSTRIFDLHTLPTQNQFFDFLPLTYGEAKNHAIRLHLFTLPTHDLWPTVNMNLLWGVDGIVNVIDSRLPHLSETEKSLVRLKDMLHLVNRSFSEIPMVFQYNHRDAPSAVDVRALRSEYARHGASGIEAVAVQDRGVIDTLDAIAERILSSMENSGQTWSDRNAFGLQ
jgi:signal recognition particle receptor subunit beta